MVINMLHTCNVKVKGNLISEINKISKINSKINKIKNNILQRKYPIGVKPVIG